MQHTSNYGLKKPEYTDLADIKDLNDNADIIDQKLKENADALESHKNDNTAHGMNNIIQIDTDIIIAAINWVDDTANSGYWVYDIVDESVDENTVVDINIHLADLENSTDIKPVTQSFNGYYRLYADNQPETDITVDVKKIRQVS